MNGARTALIIENTAGLREWLANALADVGMNLLPCSGVAEAHARLAEGAAPDLIVVDIESVPEREHKSFCELVYSQKSSPEGGTTVLAIAHGRRQIKPDDVIHRFAARGLLTLPCTEQMLLNMADTLLKSHEISRNPLVLVVDDSEELRILLQSVLSAHGLRVLEASCGLEAVRLSAERRPDAVVLDHILPDTSGLSIMPLLKSHGDPLLLVITGDSSPSLSAEYSAAGAHAFIRKPFSAAYLADIIRKARRDWVLPPLAETDSYCRAAVQAGPDPFLELFMLMGTAAAILTPRENGKDFLIKQINAAALNMAGLSKESVLGNSIFALFPALPDTGMPDVLRETLARRHPARNQLCRYADERIQSSIIYDVYYLKPTGDLAVLARPAP